MRVNHATPGRLCRSMYTSLATVLPLCALAQSPPPRNFPPEAMALSAEATHQRLRDKVFKGQAAHGVTWRVEYTANGYAFFNNSRGAADSGTWNVEDDKLCTAWKRAPSGCVEVRFTPEAAYVRHVTTGGVMKMVVD